jgi:hypothetical protein
MKTLRVVIFILCLTMTWGCIQFQELSSTKAKKSSVAEPEIPKVDSPDLAKMILRPKRSQLDISRDPFMPLIGKNELPIGLESCVDNLADVSFLGTVKVNNQYLALVAHNKGKDVYQIQSQIRNFTITAIEENEITLTNGTKEIKMKRGVKP